MTSSQKVSVWKVRVPRELDQELIRRVGERGKSQKIRELVEKFVHAQSENGTVPAVVQHFTIYQQKDQRKH